jgi:hypothetical protein
VPNGSLCVELEWIGSFFSILCVSQDLFTDVSTTFKKLPEKGILMMLIHSYNEDPADKM